MDVFISEKQLVSKLGVCRKTIYLWRLRGLPFHFQNVCRFHYLYDYEEVQRWLKKNGNQITKK